MTISGGHGGDLPLEDPTHVPAVMTGHGSYDADIAILHFSEADKDLAMDIVNAGGFAVDCEHPYGHCQSQQDLIAAQWQFLKDHPFGTTKDPYADGLPASFPTYCQKAFVGADLMILPRMDGGATSRTVSFSAKAVSFVPGSVTHEPPLAGVVTCVVDNTGARDPSIPCVTSDANGEFTLTGLATNTPILLSSEKEQYQRVITAVGMGAIDMGIDVAGIRMIPLLADGGAPVLGWDPSVQRDPAKGSLNAFAISLIKTPEAGIAAPQNYFTNGVTFTITPAGGHDGPYYVKVDESWASGATSTVGGYGAWFLNLDPGEYTITVTHPTLPCVPINRYGWPQTDGTAKAVVVAGVMTAAIGFACNPAL